MYSHPARYMDFFDGETAGRRKGMLHKWTRDMAQKGAWADQLFVNAIARAHEVCFAEGMVLMMMIMPLAACDIYVYYALYF